MSGIGARRAWVIALFLFVLGDGLTLQTRGPLLRSFEAEFAVSEALLGLVSPAGTLGFVAAAMVVGMLAGRIDIRRWVLLGIAATGVSLLAMAGAPLFGLLLVLLLAQGTAAGLVRGLDRPILSHLYPRNRARMFLFHSLAWAIGAVAGPVYITAVLARADWRVAYALLGLCFLPLGALIWTQGLPTDVSAERAITVDALGTLLRRPIVVGMAIATTLAGATEGIVFTWLPYFASEFMPLGEANTLLTLFLLAYIPSRLMYTRLIRYVDSLPLVTLLCAGLVIPLWIALSGTTGPSLYGAVFMAGFFAAGGFPLIPAFGVDAVPSFAGPVTAMGTGGYYLGMAAGPGLVGLIAARTGIAVAINVAVLTAVGACGVLAITWMLARFRRDR